MSVHYYNMDMDILRFHKQLSVLDVLGETIDEGSLSG